jgi:uncharacterized protein with ATP-grasp and redox domains
MAFLAQLAHPDTYRRCDWDLRADDAGRAYWDGIFRWHLDEVLLPLIEQEYAPSPAQCSALRRDYLATYDELSAHPERYDRVDILLFTELRRAVLARHGFPDPFQAVKHHENEAALSLLPQVLDELDTATPQDRWQLLARGLMAGNLFDLGAPATVQRHRDGNAAFRAARDNQPTRPWLIDDETAWRQRWQAGPGYRHVVFFVDNAGGDIVLGCLPLARWMLQAGACVTLAANSEPALNDITAAELSPLLERCAALDARLDEALRESRLRIGATGTRTPLLDLAALAPEFVAETSDADLIVLHGMGRVLESNFYAGLRCDALRTAVLKDEHLAARFGGKLFDCVFQLRPAET